MAVARNADGRMEAFARGIDRALIHIWQLGPNTGWAHEWDSLGGSLRSVPAVGRNADGRLEAFAVTRGGRLWHTWQFEPNSRRPWSPWAPLESPPGGLDKAPVVARNAGGNLEVFSRGPDGRVWHIGQGGPIDGWSSWHSLGGALTSAPAVSRNADGRLEVFGRGPQDHIWHTWQGPIGWSEWERLSNPPSGMLTPVPDTDGFPSVGQNADGRLQVFGRLSLPVSPAWTTWQGGPFGGWSGGMDSRLGACILKAPSVGG